MFLRKSRKSTLRPQDVVVMSTVQHLAPSEIALISGVSRQWVWKILRQNGVNTAKGPGGATRVMVECSTCGRVYEVTRRRWRDATNHYCSKDCYYASRYNPNYYQWRHGTRIARVIVSQYFNILPEHVVHHKDGDERNNDRSNLSVFASQSDHTKHHRGINGIKPLWDGRMITS